MPTTLLSCLRALPAQFLPRPPPVHLRGLATAHFPVNQLWREFHSEANLEQAFVWLCEQNAEAHHNHDVWDYRRQWPERKAVLRDLLLHGEFAFQPVRLVEVRNEQGEIECREARCAEDRLVIRALAQVLQPVLSARLSPHCTHLQGHGGVQQAVRDTQDYIAAHPESFVIKSDVKGYYASIDHSILAEQLRALLPHEIELHRLVWNFMRRTTEYGGDYTEVERGLPLGASLSPVLGAVYLSPLDALGTGAKDGFYRRYMDDWVWVLPKRHALRRVLKAQYAVLQALRVEMHPDKTFFGKVAKGFDFLGFHCCPTGMRVSDAALSRRDKKLARLYELGADKKRIALYLALWLGWAGSAGGPSARAGDTAEDGGGVGRGQSAAAVEAAREAGLGGRGAGAGCRDLCEGGWWGKGGVRASCEVWSVDPCAVLEGFQLSSVVLPCGSNGYGAAIRKEWVAAVCPALDRATGACSGGRPPPPRDCQYSLRTTVVEGVGEVEWVVERCEAREAEEEAGAKCHAAKADLAGVCYDACGKGLWTGGEEVGRWVGR